MKKLLPHLLLALLVNHLIADESKLNNYNIDFFSDENAFECNDFPY